MATASHSESSHSTVGNRGSINPQSPVPNPQYRNSAWHTRSRRTHYADIYGPTTGDRVRLGDTGLVLEVESDATTYGDECKFGGGKVLRDGMGQAAGISDARGPRLRHHQCADRRLDRHPQGRRRHQGRTHRRYRQGRQPRRDGRRHRRDDRRRHDRSDCRRRADPDGRRHRRAHSLHLSAAGLRGARQRGHHLHRRRHRPGHRHQRDHLHAGQPAHRVDAAGDRHVADELRLSRQRQLLASRRVDRADRGRRDRLEAARGLGIDAGGDRRLPRASPTRTTSRWRSTPTR